MKPNAKPFDRAALLAFGRISPQLLSLIASICVIVSTVRPVVR